MSNILANLSSSLLEPILSTVLKDCFTQLGEAFKTMGHPVTVIATTSDIDKVPTSVLGCFLHEIGFDVSV